MFKIFSGETYRNNCMLLSAYFKKYVSWCPSVKVIREKSRGEGSLIGQGTIENVSEPKFFF